jgi:hypothetical protein
VTPVVDQSNDMVELRLIDSIQFAATLLAALVTTLKYSILDVRRDARVVMFRHPFLDRATHCFLDIGAGGAGRGYGFCSSQVHSPSCGGIC